MVWSRDWGGSGRGGQGQGVGGGRAGVVGVKEIEVLGRG